jgi:hypothetical protein
MVPGDSDWGIDELRLWVGGETVGGSEGRLWLLLLVGGRDNESSSSWIADDMMKIIVREKREN